MTAWADHGDGGNGELLAMVLRPGNAGSNTAAGHPDAARLCWRSYLADCAGGATSEFMHGLTVRSRPLHHSAGMTTTEDMQDAIVKVPVKSWTPAYYAGGRFRAGAWTRTSPAC